jgi:putative transposase
MDDYESLSHTKWECKYHVVFIPKCRRKTLYGQLQRHLGEVFRKLAMQKECRIGEGHLMPDHVHMMISIPPKYAVSQVIGFIKGKSAIHLARVYGERKRNFMGRHFWARGVFRLDRRARRSCDQGIHQKAGRRGYPPGSTQHVALACHLQVAQQAGPRQRPRLPL